MGKEIRACRVDELLAGEAMQIDGPIPIAVFNVDGTFYATQDTCTHAEASLSEGFMEGSAIVCPFHMAQFSVVTGEVLTLPATAPLRTFAVRVADNEVWVDVEPAG